MRIIARLNIGGPAIHVAVVTAGLNDSQFVSTLVTGQVSPTEGDMTYYARQLGVEPVVIPGLGREISLLSDLRALFALIGLIRRERPDIVHTHTAKAGLLGRLAAWLCGVPVILHTFHGHVFHGYFGPLKTHAFIILEQMAACVTAMILTISPRLREDLIEYRIAPPARIRVVPLGLDLTALAVAKGQAGGLRRELGLGKASPLVGIVGRLVAIKNHEMFLAAASHVAKSVRDGHFVIVGDGERRPHLERMVEVQGLRDRVHFLGWRRDLPVVYADLDMLVLCSRNEGTPVSLIEAMAAGVPVVSTAVGGVPDLLQGGDLGILVASGDELALAEAIISGLKQPDHRRIKRAKAHALNQFGAERVIDDLRHLYRELLSNRGRSGSQ